MISVPEENTPEEDRHFGSPDGSGNLLFNDLIFASLQLRRSPPVKFSMAFSIWAKAGFPVPTPAEVEAREEACKACEEFQPHPVFGYRRCQKCGCTLLKASWATEDCPLGKWGAIDALHLA